MLPLLAVRMAAVPILGRLTPALSKVVPAFVTAGKKHAGAIIGTVATVAVVAKVDPIKRAAKAKDEAIATYDNIRDVVVDNVAIANTVTDTVRDWIPKAIVGVVLVAAFGVAIVVLGKATLLRRLVR